MKKVRAKQIQAPVITLFIIALSRLYCAPDVYQTEEYHMSSKYALLDNVDSQFHIDIRENKILPGMLAIVLGLVLLYVAGFAETAELHSAAHDARHSASFPCH